MGVLERAQGGGRAREPCTEGVTVGWMHKDVQESEQCRGAWRSDAYGALVQGTPAVRRLTVSPLSFAIPGAGVEQSLGKDLGLAGGGGRQSPSSGHSLKPVPRAPCTRAGVALELGAAVADVGDALRGGMPRCRSWRGLPCLVFCNSTVVAGAARSTRSNKDVPWSHEVRWQHKG